MRRRGDVLRATGASAPAVRNHGAGRNARRGRLLVCAWLLVLAGVPCLAQQSGQWWWGATVGFGQRSYENEINGSPLNEFDQNELNVSFDLNGFIVHPAIASFRLGTDFYLADAGGRQNYDSDRLGFGGDLRLLPYGAVPMRLYVRRAAWDFTNPANDPFTLVGAPDTNTQWGGGLRVARGPLSGFVAGFEHDSVDFLDPSADEQVIDRQFVNWSRRTGNFQHRVRVERRNREYGTVDYDLNDLSAFIDERGAFSPTWDWTMYGSSLSRGVTIGAGPEIRTDIYRLRNRFLHRIHDRDLLDLRFEFGRRSFEGVDDTDNRLAAVFYRWRPTPSWEVAPFVSYADQTSGPRSVASPRLGMSLTWRRLLGAVSTVLGGQASYGQIDRKGLTASAEESELAWSVNGTLGHGSPERLRKEFEFTVSHNELRPVGDPITDLPDLGLPAGLGARDFYRTRVTLGHRWDSSYINGWTEWNLQQSSPEIAGPDFEAENLSGTLEFGRQRFAVQASGGQTRVEQGALQGQEVSFLGASGHWRVWRPLTLRALYRSDFRDFLLTEDIDGDRYEAGAVLRFGRLSLDMYAYQSEERLSGGGTRINRGFNWTVSTRFSGLLPIVTGTQRRGVIR